MAGQADEDPTHGSPWQLLPEHGVPLGVWRNHAVLNDLHSGLQHLPEDLAAPVRVHVRLPLPLGHLLCRRVCRGCHHHHLPHSVQRGLQVVVEVLHGPSQQRLVHVLRHAHLPGRPHPGALRGCQLRHHVDDDHIPRHGVLRSQPHRRVDRSHRIHVVLQTHLLKMQTGIVVLYYSRMDGRSTTAARRSTCTKGWKWEQRKCNSSYPLGWQSTRNPITS
mmetsp:Transcript_10084/g.25586  ORF Transcript_10084/g.25586 Transcript_10084/m.25586 type:complete len:219 (-) Transcript_10084:54-710(-)